MLLALSRKDFVGALTGRRAGRPAGRDARRDRRASREQASILRVHDVAAVADFLRVREALAGEPVSVPALDPGAQDGGSASR